jgi:hypothetical protein
MSCDNVIVVKPCGGFGNRVATLIGGTFLGRLLNYNVVISWDPCWQCDCNFEDLFMTHNASSFYTHEEYTEFYQECDAIFFSQFTKRDGTLSGIPAKKNYVPINAVDKFNISTRYKKILYKSFALPDFITYSDILDILDIYKLHKSFYITALDYITKNNITYNDVGYHVRLTNCHNPISRHEAIMTLINNKSSRYFVCSCEREFEKEILTLNNVLCRSKEFYPEFYLSYNHMMATAPSSTLLRKESYKDHRYVFPQSYISKNAIIEGIIDMLILSRTNIVNTVPSTFKNLAGWYSNFCFGKTNIRINNRIHHTL